MPLRGTEPELYITDFTLVYAEKRFSSPNPHAAAPLDLTLWKIGLQRGGEVGVDSTHTRMRVSFKLKT